MRVKLPVPEKLTPTGTLIYSATGHRPNKLGGYSADAERTLFKFARQVITEFGMMKPTTGISGMAQGWDMAWAEALIDLDIPLVAAIPFEGQEKEWPPIAKSRYRDILACAQVVHVVSDGDFAAWKYMARNAYMVDNSDFLVALWDGTEGGTHNCITYAAKVGKPWQNMWDAYSKLHLG